MYTFMRLQVYTQGNVQMFKHSCAHANSQKNEKPIFINLNYVNVDF